jgi:hypothetical protein
MQDDEVPKGYMRRADGTLVPRDKVKAVDMDRHQVVLQLVTQAKAASSSLAAFKLTSMQAVQDFVDRSLSAYDARLGGVKGNVTLTSFDGQFKVVRAIAENIVFDERLQAAKSLIDDCLVRWVKGSNTNIKAIVNRAFQVDKQGLISTSKVLSLRSLDIEDPQWAQAMRAISDSMQVVSTKAYLRFYERNDAGGYDPINLDVAG